VIDSYTIVRRDARVPLEGEHVDPDGPAAAVLDMLCAAMHALALGDSADAIVCSRLGHGLRADAAVTIALEPERRPYVVCAYPKTVAVNSVAEGMLARQLQSGEEQFCVEFIEDVGHVASMWIQPSDPEKSAQLEVGRVLVFVRSRPFSPSDRQLLDRASDALVALWPHAARSVRAQQAKEWVQATAEETHMTDRELQVLGLLAEGLLATSIASRLRLSPRTVHKHLGNIYRKLGVHDRLVAVSLARLQGLVDTYPSSPTSPARV